MSTDVGQGPYLDILEHHLAKTDWLLLLRTFFATMQYFLGSGGCKGTKEHAIAIQMCQMSDGPGCILGAFWCVILVASNDCAPARVEPFLRDAQYFAPSYCMLLAQCTP